MLIYFPMEKKDYPAHLAETKKALTEHSNLPLFWRIGRRAVGKYPPGHERKELKRFEMTPWERASEDVTNGLYWTRRLNNLGVAIVGNKWVTASTTGDAWDATVPVEITSKTRGAVIHLLEEKGHSPDDIKFDSVGAFVPGAHKRMVPQDVQEIGICVMSDYNAAASMSFTKSEIADMSDEHRQEFEDVVEAVASNAELQFFLNRPDPI